MHGGCVTVGCIPVKDHQIEELYVLASYAKQNGQDFIPVHIFPVNYNNAKSFKYLALQSAENKDYQLFAVTLQDAYDYFNHYKKIPTIAVGGNKGEYFLLR